MYGYNKEKSFIIIDFILRQLFLICSHNTKKKNQNKILYYSIPKQQDD